MMANNDLMQRQQDWLADPFFDEIGRRFFGNMGRFLDDADQGIAASAMNGLPTDVHEHQDHYALRIDTPGVNKDDIKLRYKDQVLTVGITKHELNDHTDKDGNVLLSERRYGTTSRAYQLPNVDAKNIKAQYADGVLTVTLPKLTATADTDHDITID